MLHGGLVKCSNAQGLDSDCRILWVSFRFTFLCQTQMFYSISAVRCVCVCVQYDVGWSTTNMFNVVHHFISFSMFRNIVCVQFFNSLIPTGQIIGLESIRLGILKVRRTEWVVSITLCTHRNTVTKSMRTLESADGPQCIDERNGCVFFSICTEFNRIL